MIQSLYSYASPNPQKPFLLRLAWFLFFKPLVACSLPGTNWRKFILRSFGANFGAGGRLKPYLSISYPWNLVVGDHCWLGESVWIDCLARVEVGHNVCISQGSYLCTGNHDYKKPTFDLRLGPILIDAEVWIGAKSILAPSSIIGKGSVVCIGSVVTGSVHPYSIVRGNPAVLVGHR